MKKIIFLVALIAAYMQTISAQEKTTQTTTTLDAYYAVKDALVSGNAALANSKAIEFVKIATADAAIPEVNRAALLKDAAGLAETKDIKKQRTHFSALSGSMFSLVKSNKTGSEPIYKAYCPMVKASWLSNSPAIKNPYYGSAMLTCGSVVETLK